jgi:hypothetical protein
MRGGPTGKRKTIKLFNVFGGRRSPFQRIFLTKKKNLK